MTLKIHSTFTVKPFLAAAIAVIMLTSATKDQFTPPEQQQISIETPGLFDRSDAFTVDFASLRPADYSFPLPVGKAKLLKDNTLEISTTKGDAVKAMFGGTVRLAKHIPGHGNVIVVRHANGSFAIMVNGGRINPATLLNPESHRLLRQTILCKKAPGHVSLTVTHPDKEQLAQAEAEKRRQQVKEFTENPFADGNKFSITVADLAPGQWCYPLPGAKVISRYGRRGGRMHSGVDLKTKPNDEILAAFDGVVTMSQRYYAYGNYIKIRHANGIETCYSHNSKNLVKKGDVVKAGQVIALTGRTGRATTEHLHFECRVNGQTFDPAKIFDHANQAVKMDRLTFTKSGRSISIKAEKNYMAKGK